MAILLAEIWRAWRASARRPGFLLLASGVLALGIGASVAVFTLIEQELLQPLPLPEASRVMVVGPMLSPNRVANVSPMAYQHLAGVEGVASVGLARVWGRSLNISGGGRPEVVSAVYIDRGVLPTLGLHPTLGRTFTAREDAPHGPHVVMLGHAFWEHRYAGAVNVVGQTLQIKGAAYTIVGVMPAAFDGVLGGDIVLPQALPANSTDYGLNDMALLQLDKDANRQSVLAEINARMHAMHLALPQGKFRQFILPKPFGMQTLADFENAGMSSMLTLFMACALFVLLTALVNLVNLMLLRSQSHAHDSAVRGALGASPLRLALPVLAEGLLVGVIGALTGTLLAWLGLIVLKGTVLTVWLPDGGVHVSLWIWLLALAVAVLIAVLAAGFGVWRRHATTATQELREGGRSGLGRRGGWLGRVLVVVQMVLATVLLCGSGLLLHGLYKMANTPLGFTHSAHVLTFELAPVQAQYSDAESVGLLAQQLVRRLEAVPGVTAAVATTNLPTDLWSGQFQLGGLHMPGGQSTAMQYRGIGPGYFKLFGIPVQQGRTFTRNDVRGGEPVAVVNRALARHMYSDHALGQLIQRGSGADLWSARIVGVVGDTRQFGPLRAAPDILYVPLAQMPADAMGSFRHYYPMRFVLRGHGDPNHWRAAVQAAVAQVAPVQPISNFRTMHQVVRSTTVRTHRTLLLIGIFAALAVLLATAGMYAVMSAAIAAREREFGVRMALGAAPSRLLRLVLWGGLAQIAIGLVIGVGMALGFSHVLSALLVNLLGRNNAMDPMAIAGVCLLLAFAGLLACLLPALRAARVQPMHALRRE